MTEQVSEDVFKAFKDEVLRAIESMRGSVSELSGKIEVYTQLQQSQATELAVQANDIKNLNELKKKVQELNDQTIRLDEASKNRQRNTIIIFSVISAVIGTVSVLISFYK